MKFKDEIKLIKTDRASLRSFAWIVGGIFFLLGLFFSLKQGHWGNPFSVVGAVLLMLGVIMPALLKPVYLVWMTLGLAMGVIVAPVMFTLLFYIAVAPISLIARLSGKKFLDLQFKTVKDTYWIEKQKNQDSKKSMEDQF